MTFVENDTNGLYYFLKEIIININQEFAQVFSKSCISLEDLKTVIYGLDCEYQETGHSVRYARFEVYDNKPIIIVNNNESRLKRLAVAHEIAHLYIYKFYPHYMTMKGVKWHETFASLFSYELLIPIAWRFQNLATFHNLSRAIDFVRFIRPLDISPKWFIKVMQNQESWFRGYKHIIIIAAKTTKLKSQTSINESKMRTVEVFLDSNRFFIPTGQSIEKQLADTHFLDNLKLSRHKELNNDIYQQFENKVTLKYTRPNSKPKYLSKQISCVVSVMPLMPTKDDHTQYNIILITPNLSEINQNNSWISL